MSYLHERWPITYTYIKPPVDIPRLPGTADRGAPLPEPDWNNRFTMVKVGENPDGSLIIEARPKPPPPGA